MFVCVCVCVCFTFSFIFDAHSGGLRKSDRAEIDMSLGGYIFGVRRDHRYLSSVARIEREVGRREKERGEGNLSTDYLWALNPVLVLFVLHMLQQHSNKQKQTRERGKEGRERERGEGEQRKEQE